MLGVLSPAPPPAGDGTTVPASPQEAMMIIARRPTTMKTARRESLTGQKNCENDGFMVLELVLKLFLSCFFDVFKGVCDCVCDWLRVFFGLF